MQTTIIIGFLCLVLVALLMQAWLCFRLTRFWLQSSMAGGKVSVFDLIGMTFRKVDPAVIVTAHVQAVQGGVDIPVSKLESAHLAGANVDRVVLAAVTLQKRGEEVDFDSLLAADLQDRLAEKLNLR